MPPTYSFNSLTGTIASGTTKTQVFNGNPSRVSLIVSTTGSVPIVVSSIGGSGSDGNWAIVIGNAGIVLKFADLGPIIQQPLFISQSSGIPVTVTATEVYKLSGCK